MSAPVERQGVLQLEHISKAYGRGAQRVEVVRDASLSVAAGETVWLRGPSGSGKSSLLRIAGLLSTPDTGSVVITGERRTSRDSADLRRDRVGFVFQHSNLLPDLTVAENVAVASRSTTRQEVLDRLAEFGLSAVADRPAKQVSGGEAQRAAICRALVNDPVLLLVDEPTSGLDQHHADVVRQHLDRARGRGRALLVASHDPHTATFADRVLDMHDGALV